MATRKWSLAFAKRNSVYWLGKTLPHVHKMTFKSIFQNILSHQCIQRRHALQTKDVFFGILTKTGWWIRRPDFYRFSLWFHLKFPINNCTLPITKLYKTRYIFTKYYFMLLCCMNVPFLIILRETTHVWRTRIVWRLEAFVL